MTWRPARLHSEFEAGLNYTVRGRVTRSESQPDSCRQAGRPQCRPCKPHTLPESCSFWLYLGNFSWFTVPAVPQHPETGVSGPGRVCPSARRWRRPSSECAR